MSINFLNVKYFVIFSLLQYLFSTSTGMVLKSPRSHGSKYIKKQSTATFHIHNPYVRRNLDYKYLDWEEKQPDVYDYILPSTNQTSTTLSNVTSEITAPETTSIDTNREIPTMPITGSFYNTYNLSVTYPTLSSTAPPSPPSPDTSSLIPSTDSTPFSLSTSLATTSSIITTTTLIPEVTTENIFTITTSPSSTATPIDPVKQAIRKEIQDAKINLRGGYFTASIYVLLKIIERKESQDVTSLLVGLHHEFTRLNSLHRLAMFGPMVNSVFTTMVRFMATAPIELIHIQARNGIEIIENKRQAFQLDTKAIFDVVDAIYIEEDFNNIAAALTDIENFPNVPKHATDVAAESMVAFIFIPYTRVEGTAREKLLMMEINNVVQTRIFIEQGKTMRRHFGNYEITTEMTELSKNITKFKDKTRFTKAILRELFPRPTTIDPSATDYTSYVKDPIIMELLRHKMWIYKAKFRKLKNQDKKFKTKRGMTSTTTTTTTTTIMPPMRKSKYYMRKYVKKNLYKMKLTTIKTTRFTWRYYGKIRKFMDDDAFGEKNHSISNDTSDSEGYYSESDEENYESVSNKSDGITASMGVNKVKSAITNENSITNHNLYNNEQGAEIKFENVNRRQRFDEKRESSDSNAEAYLQVNLKDALFHTSNRTINRRFIKKKINKLREMNSFSDDEAVLKSNIYKVFGYSNDFSKRLRAFV